MYDRLLAFLWYNLLLAPSSCLIHPLFKIFTNTGYQGYIVVLFFFLNRSFILQA